MIDRLYFRQLLAGRDFARDDPVARAMRNFVYLVGDLERGEAIVVDPAYRPDEIVELASRDALTIVGALATHYHPDHVGGTLMGRERVAGAFELRQLLGVSLHVQRTESTWITSRTALTLDDLILHDDGDVISVGEVTLTLRHTPGHTPGSQCVEVAGRLLSGDTLFLDGCGRTDLPGGDAAELYRSLHERLAVVADDVVLFPGHLYSEESSLDLGTVRRRNAVLAPRSAREWLALFGA